MVTTALYHWKVSGSPVNILIDLSVIDRFRVAAASSDSEIGGLLLGHFDGNFTVINDFDLVECEHRRGAAYTLSQRDDQRLSARIETRRKRGATVVGFFRSHLRPGLFLDEGDNSALTSHFNNPSQVVLLIRPAPDRTATGGFFFWEDGEMNRKQTYLPFPMNARELEMGDYPLVEPVSAAGTAPATPATAPPPPTPDFDNAETLDSVARPAQLPVEETEPASRTVLPEPRRFPTRELEPIASHALPRKIPWTVIGLIAAGAAFGGYLIGTSGGHRDRFGARSGDITVNSSPEPQPAVPPDSQPLASESTPSGPAPFVNPPTPAEVPEKPTVLQSPPSVPAPTAPTSVASTPPSVHAAPKPEPALRPAPARPTSVRATVQPKPATQSPVPAAAPDQNASTWQHFHPGTNPAPSQVADSRPAPPPPVATPAPAQPAAEASVSLESVESGGIGRAFGKIPLFGSLHRSRSGDNFVPPQALHSYAPKVPHDLARELTGTLPVDLKLTVDKSGHVSSVEIISHQTPTEFLRLAGDAAYDWQFEPAKLKDKPISSDVIAHFRFRPAL